MKNIFIGMLLVFLNFNLDVGSVRIGLIPTFLGYIFMLNGVSELLILSSRFSKVKPYIAIMVIYSGINYAMDILGISAMLGGPLVFVLGLFSTTLSLVISYYIIMGIKDIEITKVQSLNTDKLYSSWKLYAVFSLITYLLLFIPLLAIICIIVGFIVAIYYLYVFNETKNLYYKQN